MLPRTTSLLSCFQHYFHYFCCCRFVFWLYFFIASSCRWIGYHRTEFTLNCATAACRQPVGCPNGPLHCCLEKTSWVFINRNCSGPTQPDRSDLQLFCPEFQFSGGVMAAPHPTVMKRWGRAAISLLALIHRQQSITPNRDNVQMSPSPFSACWVFSIELGSATWAKE